jgi:23S rRNA (cytosine1962-C5)-methyltransferase
VSQVARIPSPAGSATSHRLIDVGGGRRLDLFGTYLVDRPAPAARDRPRTPERWGDADARFDREAGWATRRELPEPWRVELEGLTFELALTASGQVGLFPEQAPDWRWLSERVAAVVRTERPRVLNLFAYTGGASLAATRAGAQVVHVDAVRSALAWARRNALASGLDDAPIRWIPDDAVRFVERELRRGRRYEAIVLDPPSYGQGPGGERWRLAERLPSLLERCVRLLDEAPIGLLVSAHTLGLGAEALADLVRGAAPDGQVETVWLGLDAESGARLPLGVAARWTP